MDLFEKHIITNQRFLDAAPVLRRELRMPDEAMGRDIQEGLLQEYNDRRQREHARAFPLNDNLFALIFLVLADLSEVQRERITSTLTLRGLRVEEYTFRTLREAFIELFCAPRTSIENPNLRQPMTGGRSFLVIDTGDCEGTAGYWVEEDETGDVGFLPEIEDIFWQYSEESGT